MSSRMCQPASEVYWKNFTSCNRTHELGISFEPLAQIYRRVDPGKSDKVVHEMSLVEISAAIRQVGPGNSLAGLNLPQHLLKTKNSAKKLGRQADLMTKSFNEVLV